MISVVQGELDRGAIMGFEGVSSLGDAEAVQKAKEANEALTAGAPPQDNDDIEELADPKQIINASRKKLGSPNVKAASKRKDDDDNNIDEDGNKID
jgi:hypothetical protein